MKKWMLPLLMMLFISNSVCVVLAQDVATYNSCLAEGQKKQKNDQEAVCLRLFIADIDASLSALDPKQRNAVHRLQSLFEEGDNQKLQDEAKTQVNINGIPKEKRAFWMYALQVAQKYNATFVCSDRASWLREQEAEISSGNKDEFLLAEKYLRTAFPATYTCYTISPIPLTTTP